MKVLIVEDDPGIVETINITFQMRWHEARLFAAYQGRHGVAMVKSKDPDIVILDLGLPDIDGFTVLKKIRQFSAVPVIILTASSQESNIIKALEWGADDYITKPWRTMELLARLNTVMRRQMPPPTPVGTGQLHLDPVNRNLYFRHRKLRLTPTEVDILYHLIKSDGRPLTTDSLAQKVWGNSLPGSLKSISLYIRHLQTIMEDDPHNPRTIVREDNDVYRLICPVPHEETPVQV